MPATPDRLIATYIKIRDRRSELRREWAEQDAELKQQLDQIENAMLVQLKEQNGASLMRTDHGTAYIETTTKASIADWSAFTQFAVDNDALDMLEKRVRSKDVQKYIEEYNDAPPGITVFREQSVRIRKPS